MAQCEFQPYPFHPGPIPTTSNEQRTTPLPDHEDDPFHPGPIPTTSNEQRTTPLPDHEDDDEEEDETRESEN